METRKGNWVNVYANLVAELGNLYAKDDNDISLAEQAISICRNYMQQLKEHVHTHSFTDKAEEIHFFKKVKPQFYGLLLFYQRVFYFETSMPLGNLQNIEFYIQKELGKLKEFYEEYNFFFQYHRSASTLLDDIFFTRAQKKQFPLGSLDFGPDPDFTTCVDIIIAQIQAGELIQDYIFDKIDTLNNVHPFIAATRKRILHGNPKDTLLYRKTITGDDGTELRWTDSKSALVELLYSLHAKGCCNNGQLEIWQLAKLFERCFGIDLKNIYRTFQDISNRKSGQTAFLDELKKNLDRYISNPG